MFWCVLTVLYNVLFSRAARGTPACQRISTHGYGDFGSQRNGRVGILFCCVSTFYTMHLSPGLRGENQLAGGSLLAVAAILIRIQA